MGKLLGIDYGGRRIGLATAAEDTSLAFPLQTIQYDEITEAIQQIKDVCVQENVLKIIMGLPKDQHGGIGEKAREVEMFSKKLTKAIEIPIEYEDERFTSVMAAQHMKQKGKKEHEFRTSLDQEAATIILQSYLDRIHG